MKRTINLVLALIVLLSPMLVHGYNFTWDLTLGSTGSDVVSLQEELETRGYLVMPMGVSKGYFGQLTRAALARYQQAEGIQPDAGYFGSITRSKFAILVATCDSIKDTAFESVSANLEGGLPLPGMPIPQGHWSVSFRNDGTFRGGRSDTIFNGTYNCKNNVIEMKIGNNSSTATYNPITKILRWEGTDYSF